ncbi:CBO0543 family protein [Paenibacillus chartarius]|uniref:CBO0543 family protein n=1 Tax=Paenibacillus chartarius TaxID=747481 RepID=A0ABV6DJ60_9BACL
MVIIIFTLSFLMVFVITKSYKYVDQYYQTVLYVSLVSIIYPLICRGHMVWHFPDIGYFTDKANFLFQAIVLFPSTTVFFLRFLPRKVWSRVVYFLGFVGLYSAMEAFMVMRGEIIYKHGWNFGWSMFVDLCLFGLMWIHARSWRLALFISLCILTFLVLWFRVPMGG